MAQVREREELGSGHDTIPESARQATRVPTVEEVRTLVEGPPSRRPIRWLRWLGVVAALVLAAGVAALVMRGDGSTTQTTDGNLTQLPEGASPYGTEWAGLGTPVFVAPMNGNLTQLPEGVSPDGTGWEYVRAPVVVAPTANLTQLPEGVSPVGTGWEHPGEPVAVVTPLTANPTQLPEGVPSAGTVWEIVVAG